MSELLQNQVYMSICVSLSSQWLAGMAGISQTGVFEPGIVTSCSAGLDQFSHQTEAQGTGGTSACLCSKLGNNVTLISMFKGNVLFGKKFVPELCCQLLEHLCKRSQATIQLFTTLHNVMRTGHLCRCGWNIYLSFLKFHKLPLNFAFANQIIIASSLSCDFGSDRINWSSLYLN